MGRRDALTGPTNASDPRAGPQPHLVNSAATVDALRPALSWLRGHEPRSSYAVALMSTSEASPWTVAGGRTVIGLGGFFGGEPLPGGRRLADMIGRHQIVYALVDPTLSTTSTRMIRSLCRPVGSSGFPLSTYDELFRC